MWGDRCFCIKKEPASGHRSQHLKNQCHYTKEAKWNPLKSEHLHPSWIPATSKIVGLD